MGASQSGGDPEAKRKSDEIEKQLRYFYNYYFFYEKNTKTPF